MGPLPETLSVELENMEKANSNRALEEDSAASNNSVSNAPVVSDSFSSSHSHDSEDPGATESVYEGTVGLHAMIKEPPQPSLWMMQGLTTANSNVCAQTMKKNHTNQQVSSLSHAPAPFYPPANTQAVTQGCVTQPATFDGTPLSGSLVTASTHSP